MLFHPGTRVEVVNRNQVNYVFSWYGGEVVSFYKRKYLIHFDGYHKKDDAEVDEIDIRFPLECEPYIPRRDDKIEVFFRLGSKEPKGWWEATVLSVNSVKKTLKVKWKNEYVNSYKKKIDIKWSTTRLICRGAGYETVTNIKEIEPKYDEENKLTCLRDIPSAAFKAWSKFEQSKYTKDHTCKIINPKCWSATLSHIKKNLIDAVIKCNSHQSVELGLITDEMNPAKRFSFGDRVLGVFATEDIPKHSVLGVYTGVIRSQREVEDSITLINEAERVYTMDLISSSKWATKSDDTLNIDANDRKGIMTFINDFRVGFSSTPQKSSAKKLKVKKDEKVKKDIKKEQGKEKAAKPFKPVSYWATRDQNVTFLEVEVDDFPFITVVSQRAIKKGEEILADYGKPFWENFEGILERKIAINTMQKEVTEKYVIQLENKTKEVEALKERCDALEIANKELKARIKLLEAGNSSQGQKETVNLPSASEKRPIEEVTKTTKTPISSKKPKIEKPVLNNNIINKTPKVNNTEQKRKVESPIMEEEEEEEVRSPYDDLFPDLFPLDLSSSSEENSSKSSFGLRYRSNNFLQLEDDDDAYSEGEGEDYICESYRRSNNVMQVEMVGGVQRDVILVLD